MTEPTPFTEPTPRTEPTPCLAAHRTVWLCLEPVDTLFFRDGRPFGPAMRAQSGLPNPQTLAGALRTELLRRAGVDLGRLAGRIRNGVSFDAALSRTGGDLGKAIAALRFRGPYLGRADEAGGPDRLVYPIPATLRISAATGAVFRLDPLEAAAPLPGWTPAAAGMVPLWTRCKEVLNPPDEHWITAKGMTDFLAGGVPDRAELVSDESLYGFEDRTGIAVAAETGTAKEGMIYATQRLVLRRGVRFWAGVEGPDTGLDLLPPAGESRLLPLGGEGRQAVVSGCRRREVPIAAECAVPGHDDRAGHGSSVVLVSPAFLRGWRPADLDLLAAAIPGHVPVSGWDLARGGPKPTRFAVAAGSVYFLRGKVDLPQGYAVGRDADTRLGWGDCRSGVWKHA